MVFNSHASAAAPGKIVVQVDKPGAKISPNFYGLMTEEINYSYDGGLYAEMVRNRTFRDSWEGVPYWYVLEEGNARAKMEIEHQSGPSEALKSSLRLDVEQADAKNPAGVLNVGWWGMPLRPGSSYKGSFYAKADTGGLGPVTVSLVEDNSGKTVATTRVDGLTTAWSQYEFALKTGAIAPSAANHLVLSVGHAGTLWLDLVSLFPPTYHDRVNGNRIDLMEKLARWWIGPRTPAPGATTRRTEWDCWNSWGGART